MREPSIPTPPPWGVRPLNFLRDVQPVFDRHCVGCHGGLDPAGGLDFTGGLTTGTRFLAAPSAASEAGVKCSKPPYVDTLDPDYQAVRTLVQDAVRKAWSAPRRDLLGILSESREAQRESGGTGTPPAR